MICCCRYASQSECVFLSCQEGREERKKNVPHPAPQTGNTGDASYETLLSEDVFVQDCGSFFFSRVQLLRGRASSKHAFEPLVHPAREHMCVCVYRGGKGCCRVMVL